MFWLNVFDIIGTIAFAISGALVGMRKKLDLFGIITLSIATSSFGGLFRDIIIGNLPPTLFKEPKYFVISIVTGLLTFFLYPVFIKLPFIPADKTRLKIIYILDAVGLGAFTAIGSNIAITHDMNNLFSVICMGLFTGVGGGLVRDVFVRDIPLILKKHVYASASIAGAFVMYYSYEYVSELASLYICFFITVTIRILAMRYRLSLPTANLDTNTEEKIVYKNVFDC